MRSRRPPSRSGRATRTSASSWALPLLPFVQFDYAGRLGLHDGRYLVRGDESGEGDLERVLVVTTLGAPFPGRRGGRKRKAKAVESPAEPEHVPVTRLTVARSEPFDDASGASAWLERIAGDQRERAAAAVDAVAVVNRALGALREAAEDPLVHDVGATTALAVRIGFGSGEQIADGAWTEARQLPPPPTPRREQLDPHQRVAAELAGREPEEPSE